MENKEKQVRVHKGILKKEKLESEPAENNIIHSKGVTFALHNNEVHIFDPEPQLDLAVSPVGSRQPNYGNKEDGSWFILRMLNLILDQPRGLRKWTSQGNLMKLELPEEKKKIYSSIAKVGVSGGKGFEYSSGKGNRRDVNQVAIQIDLSDQKILDAKMDRACISSLIGMLNKSALEVVWTALDNFRFSENMKDYLRRRYESQMLRTLFSTNILSAYIDYHRYMQSISGSEGNEPKLAIENNIPEWSKNFFIPEYKEELHLGCFPNHGRLVGSILLFLLFLVFVGYYVVNKDGDY